MTAVLARDVAAVNELLKLGKWVDKPDSRGRTPLMVATSLDDVPTAEALLRGGASAGPAVRVAEERGNGEMVALLKRYGSR
jgi:ankyrin repeat protein